ncbi:MAG: HAD family hydrolase [Acidimicrobiales bacterium]
MTAEAIVFDFDGTILDTEWPEFVTVREEFIAHGLQLDLADWQQVVGRADHRHWSDWLADELGRDYDRETVADRRRRAHHRLIAEQPVRDGVVDLLERAAAAGVPVAVASSSPFDWVDGHLRDRGLRGHFVGVVSRDHVERAKPWPDLFLAAAALLGVAPADAVAVEDSHHGCTAAKDAGMSCLVVPNRITATMDFSRADLVLDSLVHASPGTLGLP